MDETSNMNIYQKLAKVRAICDVARKDKKGFNYSYTDIIEILAKVTAGMKKYNVSLLPGIVPGTSEISQNVIKNIKYSKNGEKLETMSTEMLYKADMVWTWVNDENPDERIEVPWCVVASMTDPAQAMGAGLTYTQRQFLTTYFQIGQTDQIEDYRSKQREAEEAENRTMADGITDQILTIINTYLGTATDDAQRDAYRKNITDIVKKYAKDKGKSSGNPKVIKDPETATKLLQEIQDKFASNGAA